MYGSLSWHEVSTVAKPKVIDYIQYICKRGRPLEKVVPTTLCTTVKSSTTARQQTRGTLAIMITANTA